MKPTHSTLIRTAGVFGLLFLAFTTRATVSFSDPLVQRTANWSVNLIGNGSGITFANGRMIQGYAADSTPPPTNNGVSAEYRANFRLVGDFDAQFDYQVDPYTPNERYPVNGMRAKICYNMQSAEWVGWENVGHDVYLANQDWRLITVPTQDVRGSLRLVRKDGEVYSYYKSHEGWQLISKARVSARDRGPVMINLCSGVPGYGFPGIAMNAYFSNFKVTADDITGLQTESPAAQPAQVVVLPVTTSANQIQTDGFRFKVANPTARVLPNQATSQTVSGAPPGLNITLAPALSLTGDVGADYSIEYREGVDASNSWLDLTTITLTNSPQIYFDSSAIGQPSRYYRLKKLP